MIEIKRKGNWGETFLLFDDSGNNIKFDISDPEGGDRILSNYLYVAKIPDGKYWLVRYCHGVISADRVVVKSDRLWDSYIFCLGNDTRLDDLVAQFMSGSKNNQAILEALNNLESKIDIDTRIAREMHVDWLWSKFDESTSCEGYIEVLQDAEAANLALIRNAADRQLPCLGACDDVDIDMYRQQDEEFLSLSEELKWDSLLKMAGVD